MIINFELRDGIPFVTTNWIKYDLKKLYLILLTYKN